jgi:hypothetical protein
MTAWDWARMTLSSSSGLDGNAHPKHAPVRHDVPVFIEPLFGQRLVGVLPELAMMAQYDIGTPRRTGNGGERGTTSKEAEGLVDQVRDNRAREGEEQRGLHAGGCIAWAEPGLVHLRESCVRRRRAVGEHGLLNGMNAYGCRHDPEESE